MFLVWGGMWLICPLADAKSVFDVVGIHVDHTSESSAAARNQALEDGQIRAFNILLKRLVMSRDLRSLAEIEVENIDEFIRDFTVDNEKNSPIRYIADLSFRFKARRVRSLLRDLGIQFAETPSKPILILPVYEVAAAKILFDTPNLWKDAWRRLKMFKSLVPIRLPRGDLKDIGTIGAEQAIDGDELRINAIGREYKVDTVAVAYARLYPSAKGKPTLKVSVISYGSDKRASTIQNDYAKNPNESVNELLTRVAEGTAITIDDLWKKENLIKYEQGSVLQARLEVAELSDWVEVQRRLKTVAVIERVDLVIISRKEVRVNINFLGEPQQLSLALAQADIFLEQVSNSWTLKIQNSSD